ncbi:MAG: hypothetical protein NXI31_21950 [bacterium]|nr:hypothetical protein [bacterium]
MYPRFLATALAPFFALGLAAQDEDQNRLRKLRDEKMALPFVQHADWTFDYDEARRRAKLENKVIFAYFTRSYAG